MVGSFPNRQALSVVPAETIKMLIEVVGISPSPKSNDVGTIKNIPLSETVQNSVFIKTIAYGEILE